MIGTEQALLNGKEQNASMGPVDVTGGDGCCDKSADINRSPVIPTSTGTTPLPRLSNIPIESAESVDI